MTGAEPLNGPGRGNQDSRGLSWCETRCRNTGRAVPRVCLAGRPPFEGPQHVVLVSVLSDEPVPGFLSDGGLRGAGVIFRQDTPCNEQGQGTNGGPKRGADLTDNHGIAYRQ
jgi:hypothetical protein